MRTFFAVIVISALGVAPTDAQQRPAAMGVRGFATVGAITFQAQDSFDAILETHSGPVAGGGVQVLLPSGVYVELGVSRFRKDGERVFLGPGNEVFRLGIPVRVTITPVEVTGGWRFVRPRSRITPYVGGGYSWSRYREHSEFAGADENVDEAFSGFHLVGGAEYRALRWMAIGGELAWSSIPDALGVGGVSADFDETNLGGTSVRLKISIGR